MGLPRRRLLRHGPARPRHPRHRRRSRPPAPPSHRQEPPQRRPPRRPGVAPPQPSTSSLKQGKVYYCTQVGSRPPTFAMSVYDPEALQGRLSQIHGV
mmetsp:Transcript_13369/g.35575  ORF Transcript_13369/g.35575 Transcript_13369/m.35575 type:complete len:97 (-) Transcript_13369:1838-2128(-)